MKARFFVYLILTLVFLGEYGRRFRRTDYGIFWRKSGRISVTSTYPASPDMRAVSGFWISLISGKISIWCIPTFRAFGFMLPFLLVQAIFA
jgi:hypothetical protein